MAQLKTLKFNDNVVAKSSDRYFFDAPLVFQGVGTTEYTSLGTAGLVTNGNVEVTSESGHIIVRNDSCGNTTWIAMSGSPSVGGTVCVNNENEATVVSLEANCGNGRISLGDSCGNTAVIVERTGMFFHDTGGRDALSFTVQSGFHMEIGTDGSSTPLVIEGGTTYTDGFEMWYGDDPSQVSCGDYSHFQMYDHMIQLETQLCGDYSDIQLEPDRLMVDAPIVVSSGRTLIIWRDNDSNPGLMLAGGSSGCTYHTSGQVIKTNFDGFSVSGDVSKICIPTPDATYNSLEMTNANFIMSGGNIIYNHKQLQFNNDGTVTWTQA